MVTTVNSVPCESCGAPIAIRAQGISITFACQSCGSVMDSTRDGYKLLEGAASKMRLLQSLPIQLGARGVLSDVEWEVIGFIRREDAKWQFHWDEYLLFNPYHGFRFLIHSAPSNFALSNLITSRPKGSPALKTLSVAGDDFVLYHKGRSIVKAFAGEFYWRVRLNESTDYADYISPPFGLTQESPTIGEKGAETTFSLSTWTPREEVERAFKLKDLGKSLGAYPIQPNPYRPALVGSVMTAIVTIIALVVAQSRFSGNATHEQVFEAQGNFAPSEAGTEQLLGEVELPLVSQNLRIDSYSPVDNSWVEVEYELESAEGGENGFAGQAIEYYHGSDSDGAWSEGSTSASSLIGPLAGQRYKVFATVNSLSATRDLVTSVQTRMIADVPVWENFWLALLIVIAWPAILFILIHSFERQRWADSDYSPYALGDDDNGSNWGSA